MHSLNTSNVLNLSVMTLNSNKHAFSNNKCQNSCIFMFFHLIKYLDDFNDDQMNTIINKFIYILNLSFFQIKLQTIYNCLQKPTKYNVSYSS